MITQRFNVPTEWRIHSHYNFHYKGFLDMVNELPSYFQPHSLPVTMIEIGSYMGESTMMFASIGLFKTIHSIDPHQGTEEFNELFGYSWGDVEKEYKLNTRHFDNIIHHKDFSYNVVDKFEDNSIDFIYIDAEHTYESVKKDLELYLPKLKVGGVIGGHDYMSDFWPGVCRAVEEVVGTPTQLFQDSSWIKQIGCIETEDKIIEYHHMITQRELRIEPLSNVLGTSNYKDDDDDAYIDGVDERPKPKPKPYNDDEYDN